MRILRSELLSRIPNILHGFSTRNEDLPEWGNVSLVQGNPDLARENRRIFARQIGISADDLTFSFQEHGTVIRVVRIPDRGAGSSAAETSLAPADGLITTDENLPLAIMVADCACLLLSDDEGRIVGAVHAGWRGVLENIAHEAVETMERKFDISPKNLSIWIGPMICGGCFEVGEEVWRSFHGRWGSRFLGERPLRVDLPNLLIHQLTEAGVGPGRIERNGLCTHEENRLFSHRRKGAPNGRMMGVIAKKNKAARRRLA